jgi:hypothetical protein
VENDDFSWAEIHDSHLLSGGGGGVCFPVWGTSAWRVIVLWRAVRVAPSEPKSLTEFDPDPMVLGTEESVAVSSNPLVQGWALVRGWLRPHT